MFTDIRNIDPKSSKCPRCQTKFEFDKNGIPYCPKCGLRIDNLVQTYSIVNTGAQKILNQIISSKNKGRNKTFEMIGAKTMSLILNVPINRIKTPDDKFLPMHDFSLNNIVYEATNTFNYDQVHGCNGNPKESARKGFYFANLDAKIKSLNSIDISKRPDLKNGVDVILFRLVDQPINNDYSTSINTDLCNLINEQIKSTEKLNNVYIISNNYEKDNNVTWPDDPFSSICGQQNNKDKIDLNLVQV